MDQLCALPTSSRAFPLKQSRRQQIGYARKGCHSTEQEPKLVREAETFGLRPSWGLQLLPILGGLAPGPIAHHQDTTALRLR